MNISFALTTRQFLDGSKDVTRRMGWLRLVAGTILTAVVKSHGLKKGEHPVVLGKIRVVSVRRERLNRVTYRECEREGFPHLNPKQFIALYCLHHKGCHPARKVTRIEFERI